MSADLTIEGTGLHVRWLRDNGQVLTTYKERLATIADGLNPAMELDEIIEMEIRS